MNGPIGAMTGSAKPMMALVLCLAASAAGASDARGQGVPLGTPIPGQPLGEPSGGSGGAEAFLENQLTYPRVSEAQANADGRLRLLFHDKGIPYPAPEIFLRVFKHERVLELWARSEHDSTFTLVKEYPVCALPGQLGPKRMMGDVQVPEGFYFIDEFNPQSAYHLSLRVNYPNMADHMRREALSLGGDIYIHGGCQTIGCIPIENPNIEEVYWLAAQAMDAGQKVIPVHIFPSRMGADRMRWLKETFNPGPDLLAFWENLAAGYTYFEKTHRVPWVTVGMDGRYAIPSLPATDSAAARVAAMDSTAPGDSIPAGRSVVPAGSVAPADSVAPAERAARADSTPAADSTAVRDTR